MTAKALYVSIFSVFLIFGCSKSEADKCVDAQIAEFREKKNKSLESESGKNSSKANPFDQFDMKIVESETEFEARVRLICLSIASGAK